MTNAVVKFKTEKKKFRPERDSNPWSAELSSHGLGLIMLSGRMRMNIWKIIYLIERFSFEYRKVIGFAFTTLRDWFKKFAPHFHPIRSTTKSNRDSLVRFFPRFASATCNYFVFWWVHLIICVLCDWLEWLLWFWFYDTQLKTALCRHD